ncbi:hypothetical protein EVAR_84349_1 [Eumeta japonica]|uniref:Uncharacterized protein n=1 Tax=Eumeta variegata TaxID=151549 RepID=A0A4C1U5H1_EUMVA|nr:hypothetical protein EVAR_84349_1 [Eumeta japonica]
MRATTAYVVTAAHGQSQLQRSRARALPVFWIETRYLMEKEWTDVGRNPYANMICGDSVVESAVFGARRYRDRSWLRVN